MLKLNRCLALLVTFSIAATSFAADQGEQSNGKMWDGSKKERSTGVMGFEDIKQKRIEKLTLQIERLNTFRACVNEATDQTAMAACQTENRAAKKALASPNKGQIDADGIRKRFKEPK